MRTMKHLAIAAMTAAALALAGCGGGGSSSTTPQPPGPTLADKQTEQRNAIKSAITEAGAAVAGVNDESTDAQVSAADLAVAGARDAITAAADVPAEERAANTGTVDAIASRLTAAKTAVDDAAKVADAAMIATAMKLYAGIGDDPLLDSGNGMRTAVYNDDNNDDNIRVTTQPAGDPVIQALTEDKKKTVADNHGWEGKKYMASGTGVDGTYEAVVYSNVGKPTEGKKFSAQYPDGVVTLDTSGSDTPASRVTITSFDLTAGTKRYKLPDPNPSGATKITEAGSFHGVSGTYYCTPTSSSTTCTSTMAASGFTLTGGIWTFKPTDPDAKVMSMNDIAYASYGW